MSLTKSSAPMASSSFSRVHALAMLAAAGASLRLHDAWPAGVIGAVSLAAYAGMHRGRWTPSGALGRANALTVLRLALILALVPLGASTPGPAAALLVLAVFVLDGVDGWLARRHGEVSDFGAFFDMESDALLVLLCALVLHQHGRLGAFVLVPGLLRYAYVVLLMLVPASAGEAPRSRVGRYAFGVMVLAFVASLWPLPGHVPFALLAASMIAYSFGRSIYWSLRPRPRP